jgi:hypothetical protein
VGYFTVNQAVALDCQTVLQAGSTPVPAGTTVVINSDACPTGYTKMTSQPFGSTYGLHVVRANVGACRFGNFIAGSPGAFCDTFCCRVPGK